MARIATVYASYFREPVAPCTMDTVRWLRVSEALARRGHEVDVIIDCEEPVEVPESGIRYYPARRVDWDRYDMVKTLFHQGFESLLKWGGGDHPLIVSKLGSVVGKDDTVDGVYFFDERRRRLFETQQRIARSSRWITVLTQESCDLWERTHGTSENLLLVPTGVDATLPGNRENPLSGFAEKIVLYVGNLYDSASGQGSVNRHWQRRLTSIGGMLKEAGLRLVVAGPGDSDLLDPECVTYLGAVDNKEIYNYMLHAAVGLVLAQGSEQHNESSKIYEYLRCGLPVVSEEPVPNNDLISESGLGYIANYLDDAQVVALVLKCLDEPLDRQACVNYMLSHHTWDQRVEAYDRILQE